MLQHVERIVDLLDPALNTIYNMSVEEARGRVTRGDAAAVRAIDGSFAIVGKEGITVRLARSLDRPMRYFLAKRQQGPALFVADRMDSIHRALAEEGLAGQFHPSYTRTVPAHHVVELQLVGCPDPDPVYTRFFEPARGVLPPDLDEIGRRYIGALAREITKWLIRIEQGTSGHLEPLGVAFSGGIDSGAVFLVTYHVMRQLGMSPGRLKAFTLNLGGGEDIGQARAFLGALDLSVFLEEISAVPADVDVDQTLGALEDYKPLDVECAAMGLLLSRGIRERYPEWKYIIDGDGGDENLKDYPIEENTELTIRSVLNNPMLYQEGWGVGRIKHSLTYSGGLSRGYVRTYVPGRRYGFDEFSPFTRPDVIEVAEGIPFALLTNEDVQALYGLKGEITRRGVLAWTGFEMPVFRKRRFQDGVAAQDIQASVFTSRGTRQANEQMYRQRFLAMYSG